MFDRKTDPVDFDLKGAIFKNQYKSSEKQPDFTGKVTVKGEEYRISGWARKTRAGDDMMSIALTPQVEIDARRRSKDEEQRKAAAADLDDEIPF